MLSHVFIDRPIFAAVVSIVVTLMGGIALSSLPIAQYPPITPPSVQVSISYPGASAQVVADTVAAPIEQQVNGVENMLYMSSQMGNDGSYMLTVTFDLGTDLNTALVLVQNRVALALPQLPDSVQRQGITIKKKTPDILMIINFISSSGRYDDLYQSNFAVINIKDELFRVRGVSDITILGERDYSIRAWLDPQQLAARNMTPLDVAAAVSNQNLEAAPGQIGQPPTFPGQPFQVPLDTLGRLSTPEQFGDIIVKVDNGLPPVPRAPAMSTTNMAALPLPGSASPLFSAATTGAASTTALVTSNILAGRMSRAGPASSSSVGSTATSASNVMRLLTSTGPTGGGATGGGATAGGGGTTGGGGAMGGGANTGTALSAAPMTAGGQVAGLAVGGATTTGTATTLGLSSTSITPGGSLVSRGSQNPASAIVRLRDVARVELGAQNYNQSCTFDGQPSLGLAIRQLPGTNALDVATRVRAKMKELEQRFPDGIEYVVAYDLSPYIRESVADVVKTLFQSVALVGLVVLLFLQSWRAMLIPLVAVPVAIVGTFAIMLLLGFSLNNISLFGLVLAIGIVVDDAIVVVENVQRWLDQGLPPREAARRAMDEVTGPIIAVALVLCAVFIPCAFISGVTGQFFRQFAVTISVSTAFSTLNSLTLSPALAAILIKPRMQVNKPDRATQTSARGWLRRVGSVVAAPLRWFNTAFEAGMSAYARIVGKLLRWSKWVLLTYVGLVLLTYGVFRQAPTGFIPQQDQGRLIIDVQLPDSASLSRTREVLAAAEKITQATAGVAHTTTVAGLSFLQAADSSNFGSMFVVLDPFEQRRRADLRDTAIMDRLRAEWQKQIKDAQILVFGAALIPGLSVAGGFKLMVEDRGGLGLSNLQAQTDRLIGSLRENPGLVGVATQLRTNTPQLYLEIDRAKAASLGVSFDDVAQTLQIYLGSLYVNSFNAFGRYWQVTLQAQDTFRDRVSDINLLQVRNRTGQMVLMGTLVNVREVAGPALVTRYNLYTSAPITGNIRPDVSSGEAIAAIDATVEKVLPRTIQTEWTELMFMQIRAGNTAMYVFGLSVVCVFLALAALYESWSLPIAVILVVPLCLLCSVIGVLLTHTAVNIFVQIGFVVLVGLSCKNAILIVEFAKRLHQEGRSRFEATQKASRLRLRPILMTSLAFILGVLPLVIAEGAGAEMRRSLGTAVFSGMIGVTLFGVFLTPVFFYVIQGIGELHANGGTAVRWIGVCILGGLIGVAGGSMLWLARRMNLPGGLTLGCGIGVVAALMGLELLRRVKHKRERSS